MTRKAGQDLYPLEWRMTRHIVVGVDIGPPQNGRRRATTRAGGQKANWVNA